MALVGPDGSKFGEMTPAEKGAMEPGECRTCKAPIYWVTTENGKRMPLDRGRQVRVVFVDGRWKAVGAYTSHFSSCKDRDVFRKGK